MPALIKDIRYIPKFNTPDLVKEKPKSEVDVLIKHPCYKTLRKLLYVISQIVVDSADNAEKHLLRLHPVAPAFHEYFNTLDQLVNSRKIKTKAHREKSARVSVHHPTIKSIIVDTKKLHSVILFIKKLKPAERKTQITDALKNLNITVSSIKTKTQQLISAIENEVKQSPEEFFRAIRITLDDDDNIEHIEYLINRPNFTTATYAGIFQQHPEQMRNKKQLKSGLDLCHGRSNEQLKKEIKRMFEGQKWKTVAEHLYSRGFADTKITTIAALQIALFKYWSERFNDLDNLAPGPETDNRNAGRLINSLRNRFNKGKNAFKPFYANLTAFGIVGDPAHEGKFHISSWEMLVDLYYNANNDFKLTEDATVEDNLFDAASEFRFAHTL